MGQTALADQNFAEGETKFGEAEQLLAEARSELAGALATAKTVLEVVDLTGTVKSGDRILRAAEAIARAGQHFARGAEPLVNGVDAEGSNFMSALSDSLEEMRAAAAEIDAADANLNTVNDVFLPNELKQQVSETKNAVAKIKKPLDLLVNQGDWLLTLLGSKRERQYLILFENNNEQRPTGGFIGSIGLVNVDRGIIETVDVQTVYDPDGQMKDYIAPPEPLRRITNRWYLRDVNWFADYSVSAAKAADFFEKEGGPTVDGVIAMTPEVVKELLKITGPIEVPAYGVTVGADNFVALTQDQVTYSYDREVNKPKQFLADLTPLLMNKVFTGAGQNNLQAMSALAKMIQEKQLLVYMKDGAEQQRLDEMGGSGTWPQAEPGFLSVINANIGGHKSDQFVEQEIDYRSEVRENGEVEATVTIRRTHRGPEEKIAGNYREGEDPAFKDNVIYQRVFVPKGAVLEEVRGFTPAGQVPQLVEPEEIEGLSADADVAAWQQAQRQGENGTLIGEEAGYLYFANWIVTQPGATSVALYRYIIPQGVQMPGLINKAGRYSVYVAKQPGDTRTQLRTEIRLPENVRVGYIVPSDGITQTDYNRFTYRGELREDRLIGAVLESK